MKLLSFLAAACIAIGAVYFIQSRKLAERDEKVAALRAETEEKAAQVKKLEAAQKRNLEQRRELRRQGDELAAQLQARQKADLSAAAPAATAISTVVQNGEGNEAKGGFGKMVANMMKDPDMKKMIRDQQRMMMNQLYSPLIKQMGLSSEEGDRFKDLLADNMMKGAEKGASMFGGASPAERAELVKTMAEEQKGLDEQVKLFLGDARFAQYKDFQETAGERMQLNAFKQQAGGDNPLSDQQTEQLLAFMKEEKKNVAALTGQALPGGDDNAAKFDAMLSPGQSDKLLQAQETVNQRVLDRAGGVFSPEQMDWVARFQTNQMQMLRMGLSMARKMMGAGASAPAATAVAQ